jgi:hypothetical protein
MRRRRAWLYPSKSNWACDPPDVDDLATVELKFPVLAVRRGDHQDV